MKVYYMLSRLASPAIKIAFYMYSTLTRTARARLVLLSEEGDVLLLQVWPDTSKWNLPGGGLEKNESSEEAAARELLEETGIELNPGEIRQLFSVRSSGHEELICSATTQRAKLPSSPPNRWEVRRAAWFSPSDLPNVSKEARHIITEVVEHR